MNRKTLEKKIVKCLLPKIGDFEVVHEYYSSKFVHKVFFAQRRGDFSYLVSLRFIRPNFLKLQVQFGVFNNKFNDEIKEFVDFGDGVQNDADYDFFGNFGVAILGFDIEDYFSRVYGKEHSDFLINDCPGGTAAVDAEVIAENIYQRYFTVITSEFLPKMGSLETISELINANPFIDGKINVSVYCGAGPTHILSGTICALLTKCKGYESIIKKYWDRTLVLFEKGDDYHIDAFWKYISKKHPELI